MNNVNSTENRTNRCATLARLPCIISILVGLILGFFLGTTVDWTKTAVFSWERVAAVFTGVLIALVVVAAGAYV